MNLRRLVSTAAAATLATAAVAPAAHAATTDVSFHVTPGAAAVALSSSLARTRFDVLRGGESVGSSNTDLLKLGDLVANDMVAVYNGNAIVATIVYDGLPSIGEDACINHTAFSVHRAPGAEIVDAGAMNADGYSAFDATWTPDENAVVSLRQPLGSSDYAYVQTWATDGQTTVYSSRSKPMALCFEKPTRTPPTDTPPPPAQPQVIQPELTPSSGQMLQAVKGSLQAAGSSLRTRSTRKLARSSTATLPFAFPEPGRVDLELVAKGRVIGTGARTSAVNGKVFVTLRLTKAGRTLLKRSKRVKVTVKGAFTPSRAGAQPQRASVTVTLTGSSSRA